MLKSKSLALASASAWPRPRLRRSRDTGWVPKGDQIVVVLWKRVCISNGFRAVCVKVYLWHDLDLLGSRDVIGHLDPRPGSVSYRCCIATESAYPTVFEIMGPKHTGGDDLDLSRSCDSLLLILAIIIFINIIITIADLSYTYISTRSTMIPQHSVASSSVSCRTQYTWHVTSRNKRLTQIKRI